MEHCEIRSKDLNGIMLGGDFDRMLKAYERDKKYHLSESSYSYGAKLVKTKKVKFGFKFSFQICWGWIDWVPVIKFKYEKKIEWLIFRITFEWLNTTRLDRVIKDHLAESQEHPTND